MNLTLPVGQPFQLKDQIEYIAGQINHKEIYSNDGVKLVLMAMAENTALDRHLAPGDAIVFALDGEVEMEYEGTVTTLKANEQFRFEKGGKHALTAKKPFKFALLISLK